MNKTDYLVKKGRIADPANGEMFIIHSTREGVSMKKLPIWEIKQYGGRRRVNDGPWKNLTKYTFNEAPYEMEIAEGESYGECDGYSSGFGDLWGYTDFGAFDEKFANELLEKETKRVTDKYLNGKNNEPEYIPACG
jgi:hypothetical protein